MSKYLKVERRRYPRAKRILCIHHRLDARKGKRVKDSWHWHLSSTENMSAGGILFSSNVLYKPGDILELKVIMSGVLDVFSGFGRVTRIQNEAPGPFCLTAIVFVNSRKKKRKPLARKKKSKR